MASMAKSMNQMKCGVFVVTCCLLFAPIACSQTGDQFFDSNGVKIRYLVAGHGNPVILIHAFGMSAEMWGPVITDLSGNHQVIAMDCRGHGHSGKPHEPAQYGIEMVNDVMRLMGHLGIKQAHIIGYSMGGSIALKMLTEHPDRFRTAVIGGSLGFRATDVDEAPKLGPNLMSGMPFSEAMIASAPPGRPAPSPQQREMMKRMDAAQDSRALGAETVSHEGLWVDDEKLRAVKVPTLVLYGEHDQPARYEEAKRQLPNMEFKMIAGAGHGPASQSPEFLKDVREFLARQP